jgi:non-heme chloroperoxidase
MRILIALTMLGAIGLGAAAPLPAQTLVGTWQVAAGNRKIVTKITKGSDGALHGELYFVGQEFSGSTLNGNPISSIKVQGRKVHFDLNESQGTFDGNLAADGNSLAGSWMPGGATYPLKFERATPKTAWVLDPSPHKVLFVPVEQGVRLEVLDWGGSGPPLVLLSGNGDTAHVFDAFALKFTGRHHVYGITRRGFGLSSKPTPSEENYDADRLGDDVLAVIDALKLNRPVLAGHSLAGEEMSSIGTRHPERVSGLIYLDASYSYAFYNPKVGGMDLDISTMHRDLAQLASATPSQAKVLIQDMQTTIPLLQNDLDSVLKLENGRPDAPPPARRTLRDKVEDAIFLSMRKYKAVKDPVLAIVAVPHACAADCDVPDVKAREVDVAIQADAFEAATPTARVVRIAHAQHYVFLSNEAEVLREMNAFMDGLH